ncbi:MAG: histone-like nucleoid-structuring protein Lsr2 [Nocardioides sp.]
MRCRPRPAARAHWCTCRRDFLVARNPDGDSTLPYLLRIPLGEQGVILKARDTWPRTAKIYCHRVDVWPDEVEILERVPTRSCVRRGAAIDLVLDRARENRSQLVITTVRGGRQAIFWQTARTVKQARPGVRVPGARAGGLPDLEIVVDSHERYAYTFADRQVTVTKAALPAGDYGVVRDGSLLATVERKSLADLVGTLTSGRLKYQLADLAAVPRAAVVVEDRYLGLQARPGAARGGCGRPRRVPGALADGADRLLRDPHPGPGVGLPLPGRRLGGRRRESVGDATVSSWADARPLAPAPPTPAEVRAWAVAHGWPVSDRGRIRAEVMAAYLAARDG